MNFQKRPNTLLFQHQVRVHFEFEEVFQLDALSLNRVHCIARFCFEGFSPLTLEDLEDLLETFLECTYRAVIASGPPIECTSSWRSHIQEYWSKEVQKYAKWAPEEVRAFLVTDFLENLALKNVFRSRILCTSEQEEHNLMESNLF